MKRELIQVGQIGINFLLESADTNGSVAMFEFTVPVGAKVPIPHSHKHYDETIYGVEGVITFTVNGKAVDIAQENRISSRAERSTASIIRAKPMPRCSRWSPPPCSALISLRRLLLS